MVRLVCVYSRLAYRQLLVLRRSSKSVSAVAPKTSHAGRGERRVWDSTVHIVQVCSVRSVCGVYLARLGGAPGGTLGILGSANF